MYCFASVICNVAEVYAMKHQHCKKTKQKNMGNPSKYIQPKTLQSENRVYFRVKQDIVIYFARYFLVDILASLFLNFGKIAQNGKLGNTLFYSVPATYYMYLLYKYQ